MRVTLIALATLAAVLTLAPGADAFGGGGRGRGGGDSGAFGTVSRGGSSSGAETGGNGSGKTFETSEPLAALAVGLGLLGARYLRRK